MHTTTPPRSCQATNPATGHPCARSSWPGHATLPHVYYRDRLALEADNPTESWEDADHRRPAAPKLEGPVRLPVFDKLMAEVFGR